MINSNRGPRSAQHQRRRLVAQPLDAPTTPFPSDPLFPAHHQPDAPTLWNPTPIVSQDVEPKHHPFSALHPDPPQSSLLHDDYAPKPATNEWYITNPIDSVASPSDETDVEMSPLADSSLPTYTFNDFGNVSVDYKAFTIPEDEVPSQTMYDPFNMTGDPKMAQPSIDPHKLSSAHLASAAGKPRSAHRKAIEEKSSIKRKTAERRLSDIITVRLKGTFVPGLANQLNQAAELLEKDLTRIERLEAENRRLEAENRRLLSQAQYPRQDVKYYSN